jgi:PKD repeat protein
MTARFRVLAASTVALAACVAAFALSADVVVPSSAFSTGINAEFHSDVRVFNPTSSPVDFTPIFYRSDAGGNVVNTVQMPVVTIGPRQQLSYDNVLQSLFGQSIGVFGPIRFRTTGTLLVASGVNNVNACGTAGSRSGQGLSGIDVGQALKTGTLVQLAASADPATGYRSNLDFMNPGATAASVTATIRRGDGTHLSSGTFSVGPNGLVQKRIDDSGAFPGVAGTTDTNLWMEFASDQPILVFASVINNGSGDPFAVMMTSEPSAAPAAPLEPVASFTVSGTLMTGFSVTFTDTSTNSPAYRFWSFGDGTYDTSGARVVNHMYDTARSFKAGLVVSNVGGSSTMLTDIDVQPYTIPGY